MASVFYEYLLYGQTFLLISLVYMHRNPIVFFPPLSIHKYSIFPVLSHSLVYIHGQTLYFLLHSYTFFTFTNPSLLGAFTSLIHSAFYSLIPIDIIMHHDPRKHVTSGTDSTRSRSLPRGATGRRKGKGQRRAEGRREGDVTMENGRMGGSVR